MTKADLVFWARTLLASAAFAAMVLALGHVADGLYRSWRHRKSPKFPKGYRKFYKWSFCGHKCWYRHNDRGVWEPMVGEVRE